ncbi:MULTISPECIES: glucans biosynthesis glucosyltransferase MdoH [unclassified Beijerinckia]|uniref:glucans biosynthesis glucosyltransferase MdoH n=1 Tax=unclassified Beijerinckia TaxID=2638183 RepID=UPI000898E2EB|nr:MULTISPECIES: glucans biosynthesis glucosyltransferase MdoH [unclassified Beijerinckia]MDH7796653.1 membrane glycosyltransferase [Beijerinckia sp. GAS462]SEC54280.1 membrane glycosyltransferase [Beijerinckia sp. 28-YEA-48]
MPAAMPEMTPAGLQSRPLLMRRRIIVACLNILTYGVLLLWLAQILGAGGWSVIDVLIFVCFAIAAPWSVLGVWNALLGVWLLHRSHDPMGAVAPFAQAGDRFVPIAGRTAILMTIRNEDPTRAFARLRAIRESVEATGFGRQFAYFVLSDSDDLDVAAAEEQAFAVWQAEGGLGTEDLHYRRRDDNAGFKAGNVRDFCERWGEAFEFMLPLDADSLMSGEMIVRLVRIGEAWPKLGILQSLVVGAPTSSAFARIFQFGMRHGMRPYTMGSAWWSGDCGPFWGHNALVRIAPFRDHCDLPVLPGGPPLGGQILSHDQVEAVLMRRASFEVRVLPQEGESWEDNPPTVFEFTRRDLRWCQGNMQYFRLLGLPGLQPMSRFQLIWAIMMFVGIPAWTAIIALAALKPLDGESLATFPGLSALAFYIVFLLMFLTPKLAGFADIALTKGGVARYGGGGRFAAGAIIEIVFSFLLGAATTFRTGLFMLGLAFGRTIVWNGQARDAHALSWATAARGLWGQTVFGIVLLLVASHLAPALIWPSLPLTLGYFVAIPFAVLTTAPGFGQWLERRGLCAIPEEIAPPSILLRIRSNPSAPPAALAPDEVP